MTSKRQFLGKARIRMKLNRLKRFRGHPIWRQLFKRTSQGKTACKHHNSIWGTLLRCLCLNALIQQRVKRYVCHQSWRTWVSCKAPRRVLNIFKRRRWIYLCFRAASAKSNQSYQLSSAQNKRKRRKRRCQCQPWRKSTWVKQIQGTT